MLFLSVLFCFVSAGISSAETLTRVFLSCSMSQQHASVSQGRTSFNICAFCHTGIEVAGQTCNFIQTRGRSAAELALLIVAQVARQISEARAFCSRGGRLRRQLIAVAQEEQLSQVFVVATRYRGIQVEIREAKSGIAIIIIIAFKGAIPDF